MLLKSLPYFSRPADKECKENNMVEKHAIEVLLLNAVRTTLTYKFGTYTDLYVPVRRL